MEELKGSTQVQEDTVTATSLKQHNLSPRRHTRNRVAWRRGAEVAGGQLLWSGLVQPAAADERAGQLQEPEQDVGAPLVTDLQPA
jgi:hypothetical protein